MRRRGEFLMLATVLIVGIAGGCPKLGAVPSDVPDFSAARFTRPTAIDNRLFHVTAGVTRVFHADTPDGVESTTIEHLAETRVLRGIECRAVRDRVFVDGVLVEDTTDYYAQDDSGNVWYMGEMVDNYNYDSSGVLIEITHDGSWLAGEDISGTGQAALPGYQMPAAPAPGDAYHQEYYAGLAEDQAMVIAVDVPVSLASGTSYLCVQTRDENPLDGTAEFKFYATGVGLVLETALDGTQRSELIGSP